MMQTEKTGNKKTPVRNSWNFQGWDKGTPYIKNTKKHPKASNPPQLSCLTLVR